jgi:hypothetical protein
MHPLFWGVPHLGYGKAEHQGGMFLHSSALIV